MGSSRRSGRSDLEADRPVLKSKKPSAELGFFPSGTVLDLLGDKAPSFRKSFRNQADVSDHYRHIA